MEVVSDSEDRCCSEVGLRVLGSREIGNGDLQTLLNILQEKEQRNSWELVTTVVEFGLVCLCI